MADEKIIFSMNGVGKVLPHNNKVILKDIYLSFGPLDTPSGISHRNRRWIRTRLSSRWSRRACRK